MDLKDLQKPLDIADIDFRVQSINKRGYATILAYKDARVDMNRLDEAVGAANWQRDHKEVKGVVYCGIGISPSSINGEDIWVWKWDAGTESMAEKQKGEASDSFKRAGFNWGIGRELYDYPVIKIPLLSHEFNLENGKAKQTWDLKLKEWVWISEFKDGKLYGLACKDENGKLRFNWGKFTPKK
jgi:hypothetical protein